MKYRTKFVALLAAVLLGLSTSVFAQGGGGGGQGGGGQGQGQGKGKGVAEGGDAGIDVTEIMRKGNWKKGRIYYKMVCSECHAREAGGKISPSEKTKAQWIDYFEKNIHGAQDAPTKYTAKDSDQPTSCE